MSVTQSAQELSGLSPEEFATASADLGAAIDITWDEDPTGSVFFAKLDALKAQYGKPVVIVSYGPCPPKNNPNSSRWAIAGDLVGSNPAACASGFQASKEEAVAAVKARAERKGWADHDYILLIDEN